MFKIMKKSQLDVTNQNSEQMYMGKLKKLKCKHAVYKNTYNDRTKLPPAFLKINTCFDSDFDSKDYCNGFRYRLCTFFLS